MSFLGHIRAFADLRLGFGFAVFGYYCYGYAEENKIGYCKSFKDYTAASYAFREHQKQAAIAKLHRKIEAARDLFADGDLSCEQYLKRKTNFEREIAHWESRTTDVQKAAIELGTCMEILNMISSLWDEPIVAE